MGKYALLIGVSEYAAGLTALPAAANDAAAMQRVLLSRELGAFDDVEVLSNPTRDDMSRKIELWLDARQSDDLVLLFFSGHGVKDDRRELYFATGSTEKVDGKLVRATALAARTLHDALRFSSPKQQIVILDCCFSGAFGDLLARDDGDISLESQLAAEGRVVLTSTSSVDYAFEEKESELSVYTRYLVEGIEKGTADLNGDGVITVSELHDFASRKVKETAPVMSPDIISVQGQGYNLKLANAPQDKPELRYRREVEKKIRKGKFTKAGRKLLTSLRRKHGLSDTAADTIEEEVLKPFREYRQKLTEYRTLITDCLEDGIDLSNDDITDLKDYQQHLNLKDEDVRSIEQELTGRTLSVEEPIDSDVMVPAAKTIKRSEHRVSEFEEGQLDIQELRFPNVVKAKLHPNFSESNRLDAMSKLSIISKARVEDWFDYHYTLFESLVSWPELKGNNPKSQRDVLYKLERCLGKFVGGVYLLNEEGEVTACTDPVQLYDERANLISSIPMDIVGQNYGLRDYFMNCRDSLGKTIISPTGFNSAQRKAIILVMAISRQDNDGNFIGILDAVIDAKVEVKDNHKKTRIMTKKTNPWVSLLEETASLFKEVKDIEISLIDSEKNVIASNDIDSIWDSLGRSLSIAKLNSHFKKTSEPLLINASSGPQFFTKIDNTDYFIIVKDRD